MGANAVGHGQRLFQWGLFADNVQQRMHLVLSSSTAYSAANSKKQAGT